MNKPGKHKTLSDQFDREAEAGFSSVPGAETFFSGLENPFTQKKYGTLKSSRSLWFVLFELAVVLGLLIVFKYTWRKEEARTGAQPVAKPLVEHKQEITAPATGLQVKTKEKNEPALPRPVARTNTPFRHTSFVRQTAADTTPPVQAQLLPSLTVVDTTHRQPPVSVYHYADHRQYYRLLYVADMLVVDYSDSTMRLRLRPILNGVPASFETRHQWNRMKEQEDADIAPVQDTYLQDLEKALQQFKKSQWQKAREALDDLLAKNPSDQNALFYGALCRYENRDYTGALEFLRSLKEIPQPVFEQDADYYMALSHLHRGVTELALELLGHIAGSDSFYKEKAGLLLRELR